MLANGNSGIVAAVDIGTSKICVIIGEADASGNIMVLGHGERASEDSVCKGQIEDMDKASALFREALADAEESSGVELSQENIYVGITGNHITSYKGVGSVLIPADEKVVSEEHINRALETAQVITYRQDEKIIDAVGGYFVIDGTHRCANPLNQAAHKLEVFSHIICGNRNRIDNFLMPLRDLGLDNHIPVFSGIGSAFSLVSDEEHKQGVLFINMGAGTTEYLLFSGPGIVSSGVIAVGSDHIANDLSVALELKFSPVCRELLQSFSKLQEQEHSPQFLQIPGAIGKRKIPYQTVEKVIDMRLRETFEFIKERLETEAVLPEIGAGIVISGGAAMIPETAMILREVFRLPVRTAGKTLPDNFGGAVSNLGSPGYSTLLGLLHFGIVTSSKGSLITKIDRNLNTFVKTALKKIVKSIKI